MNPLIELGHYGAIPVDYLMQVGKVSKVPSFNTYTSTRYTIDIQVRPGTIGNENLTIWFDSEDDAHLRRRGITNTWSDWLTFKAGVKGSNSYRFVMFNRNQPSEWQPYSFYSREMKANSLSTARQSMRYWRDDIVFTDSVNALLALSEQEDCEPYDQGAYVQMAWFLEGE